MARLILVKHSLPAIDPQVPAHAWTLSAEGRRRCIWLADVLRTYEPDALYASHEPKARETAEIVGTVLGLRPICVDGLEENDRTGFPYVQDVVEFEARMRQFFEQPDERLVGAESANEALTRFAEAVSRIVAKHAGATLCVVAHGTVISLFGARHNRVAPFDLWQVLTVTPSFLTLGLPDYALIEPPLGYAD